MKRCPPPDPCFPLPSLRAARDVGAARAYNVVHLRCGRLSNRVLERSSPRRAGLNPFIGRTREQKESKGLVASNTPPRVRGRPRQIGPQKGVQRAPQSFGARWAVRGRK